MTPHAIADALLGPSSPDEGKGRGILVRLIPTLLLVCFTLIGARIIWPKEQVEKLEAQQAVTATGLMDLTYRFENNLLKSTQEREDLQRQLRRLLILGCLRLERGSDAFNVAECVTVLP